MAEKGDIKMRRLTNGMLMKEAGAESANDYIIEKVYGTRYTRARRNFLIKYKGYEILEWVDKSCCKDAEAIRAIQAFKTEMQWTRWPQGLGVEYLHPDLEKPADENTTSETAEGEDSDAGESIILNLKQELDYTVVEPNDKEMVEIPEFGEEQQEPGAEQEKEASEAGGASPDEQDIKHGATLPQHAVEPENEAEEPVAGPPAAKRSRRSCAVIVNKLLMEDMRAATSGQSGNGPPQVQPAASAAAPQPLQNRYRCQAGIPVVSIGGMLHDSTGGHMAIVNYPEGYPELVPTSILADHQPKVLIAYYESHIHYA